MAHASLTATSKIARLVHRFKDRLKPAKDKASIKPLARQVTNQDIKPRLNEVMDR